MKTGWQRNRLRISLVNKTAISSDDSLDLGHEPLAGVRHDDPVEGHHYPLDLQDQVLGFVVSEAFLWPLIQRRPTQNCPKGYNQGSWEARSPSPTPPWGSSGANPLSSYYCGQGRSLAGRWNVDFQLSGPSFDSIFSTVILEMFISCVWDLINLLVSLEMSSFRSAARTCHLRSLILLS